MLEARTAAPVFAALGDPTRLDVVMRLGDHGPLSTASLTAGTRFSRQAITKHLTALQRAGLVRSARAGRDRIWELETRRLAELRGYIDAISAEWDRALERLRSLVERPELDGS
jgi:DNA-binding transcriptional ArsR family regulator